MSDDIKQHVTTAESMLEYMQWETRDFSKDELATMKWLIEQAKEIHGDLQ